MVSFFKKKHGSTPSTPTTPTSIASSKDEKPIDNRQSTFFQRPSTSRAPNSTPKTPTVSELVKRVPVPAAPNPHEDPAGYLRSIHAVRERSQLVSEKARLDSLKHFRVDKDKIDETAEYVAAIIKRDFAPNYSSIPPHGRWQHFEVGGVPRLKKMMDSWGPKADTKERTRRMLDLFVVSVLLDAGAGNLWQYKSTEDGARYRRSEGLAVASFEMFKAGLFSSDEAQPFRVDKGGLQDLSLDTMESALQVSNTNPIEGLEGRTNLLLRLSQALSNTKFFGEDGRPGNMLDYLLAHPATQVSNISIVTVPTLWSVLMDGLSPIWPDTRTKIDNTPLGDAWPCTSMPQYNEKLPHTLHIWENIIPFHKLTQWLCYSVMAPMTRLMDIHFAGENLLTGLPEYRNGGLFIDTGLLRLTSEATQRGIKNYSEHPELHEQPNMEVVPLFEASDDVVVEWRAITVGILDMTLVEVNKMLGLQGEKQLSLAQMLEAGTWKGGREIAEVSRPNTRGPPIMILSDGTVF